MSPPLQGKGLLLIIHCTFTCSSSEVRQQPVKQCPWQHLPHPFKPYTQASTTSNNSKGRHCTLQTVILLLRHRLVPRVLQNFNSHSCGHFTVALPSPCHTGMDSGHSHRCSLTGFLISMSHLGSNTTDTIVRPMYI